MTSLVLAKVAKITPKRPKKEYQNQNRNMTWYVGTRLPTVDFEVQKWKFR